MGSVRAPCPAPRAACRGVFPACSGWAFPADQCWEGLGGTASCDPGGSGAGLLLCCCCVPGWLWLCPLPPTPHPQPQVPWVKDLTLSHTPKYQEPPPLRVEKGTLGPWPWGGSKVRVSGSWGACVLPRYASARAIGPCHILSLLLVPGFLAYAFVPSLPSLLAQCSHCPPRPPLC